MSTPAEAVTPSLDAPVTPAADLSDDKAQAPENVADPSPAATKDDPGDTPEPEAKWVQQRINELTRNRHEAERREREAQKERDHWRELATREKAEQKPAGPEKAKTLADFNFDEGQYHAYLLGEASKAATQAARQELQQEQSRAEKQRAAETYVSRVREFAKEHPDYKDVAEMAPISDPVAEIIVGLEEGPEVAYYLGKNPDMATQISRLAPHHAAYELGQIAARLEIEREKAAEAKAKVSAAPPPAPKIGSANQVTEKDPKDMSQTEFNKWRRKQISARKGWSANE